MTKTKPDNVADNPALLPYGSNVGAPSILIPNIDHWKQPRVSNVNKQFLSKFENLKEEYQKLVDEYKLQNMTQNIAIWFTGYTLFINNEKYYINTKSFYDEYRIFSYENNFKWYDANLCEYTEPYLKNCSNKYKFIEPLFYEIKRTDLDEFEERSMLIDNRDIKDFNLLQDLKNDGLNNNLIYIDKNIINIKKIY